MSSGAPGPAAPRFVVLERQRLPGWVVLLAAVLAAGALMLLTVGLRHSKRRHFRSDDASSSRAGAGQGSSGAADEDGDDDPSQVDVIALGDAADAPEPARRRGGHGGSVHPTILIRLPRFGPETGLIPDSPAGHLLFRWLAAFNQANAAMMAEVLPSGAAGLMAEAQMELRQQTGGYNLLSAKEIAPGVLVFRMRDQTPLGTEVLGTLVMRPETSPATVESFSLRAVPAGD